MRKASAAGTTADKGTEQLTAAATGQTAVSVDTDRDKDKKGYPTEEQPPAPQISSCKVNGVLRGAQVLMYHLLGASWHALLPAARWWKIAVT